ncbi:hypothetical protein [Phaffia rhodozyma]|uniref:HAUS augmin-like complex subunit 6 N-terminal domain-containing protein n=1 Tax=Phaffia rhodozyma TaxID=264483 RepID=A0A0F7SK68_PHARH|nr:hypothetical protein [Phaffia rhodozyma]
MSSTPSTTLLVSLLSLLAIPQPLASLCLPIHPQTPAVSRQKTRDVILRALSIHLSSPDSPLHQICPKLRPLSPHEYPTPSQEKSFVGIAAGYLTELRREIISSNGLDKSWWLELKVGIRKSDLSEAAGPRFDQILLALACQTVYWDILKTLQSRPELFASCAPNLSCKGQAEQRITNLFRNLKTAMNEIHTLQKEPLERIKRLEERRETLLEIQALMAKPDVSEPKIRKTSSEDLRAALDDRISEWDDLIRQWFEMDGTTHSKGESNLLDPALVEMALDKAHGIPYSTAGENKAVKSSSAQEMVAEFDKLETSFPQITSVVSEQLHSASGFLSKISCRLRLGPTALDEDIRFVTERVPDQTVIVSTADDLTKDIPAPSTLKLKPKAARISVSSPWKPKKSTRVTYTPLQRTSTNELRCLNLWGLNRAPNTISSTRSRRNDPYHHLIEHVNRTSTLSSSAERSARIQDALRRK